MSKTRPPRTDQNESGPIARLSGWIASLTGEDPVVAADDIRRRIFALVFSALIIPIFFAFMVHDLATAEYADAVAGGGFALLLIAFSVIVLRAQDTRWAYYVVIGALIVLFTYLISDPVEGITRLYWLYLLVPAASFTAGRWTGSIVGILQLLLIFLLHRGIGGFTLSIDDVTLFRFVATYSVLAVLMHAAEYARERIHCRLVGEHQELQRAHAEIRRLSITDALTQTYNRQFLNDRLPAEIVRAGRYGHALSVVLCDIDHFKRLNDTYGHQAGDAVLRVFSAALQRSIRHEIDWVARYGGEEFIVILPETSGANATIVAERLRHDVEALTTEHDDQSIQCTASFGVAELTAETSNEQTLVAAADTALYEAKTAGRNRVVLAGRVEPEPDQPPTGSVIV